MPIPSSVSRGTAPTLTELFPAWLILPLAGIFSLILGSHCRPQSIGICVDNYWMDHWLLSYSQGFTRRGMLGEIHRLLFGPRVDIVILNCLAWIIALWVLWSLGRTLGEALQPRTRVLALAMLAVSPLASIFFETLGDPLQLLVLALVLLFPVLLRIKGLWLKLPLLAILILLFALVHEASLFLIAPVLLLAASGIQGKRSLLRFVTLFLLVIAPPLVMVTLVSSDATESAISGAGQQMKAVNPLTGATYSYGGSLSKTFGSLLEGEEERYFGTTRSAVNLFLKPLRVLWVPFWGFVLVCSCARREHFKRMLLRTWLLLLFASLPLYVIAHDWGRFAAYSFVLALYASCLLAAEASPSASQPVPGRNVQERQLDGLTPIKALVAFILMALAYPISETYRIDGIPLDNARALAVIILVFSMAAVCRFRWTGLKAHMKNLISLD